MRQQTIIELNGKRYDARTGALLGTSRIAPVVNGAGGHKAVVRSIDSVAHRQPDKTILSFGEANAATVIKPTLHSVHKGTGSRPTAAPLRAHQPQHSKTLRRHSVKKPDITIKPKIATTTPSELVPRTAAGLARPLEKKLAVTHVSPARMLHAQNVHKSHHIQRFSRQDHIPSLYQRPTVPAQPVTALTSNQPAPKTAAPQTARDLFEAALQTANSHEQPPHRAVKHRPRHRRFRNALAAIAALATLGAFFAYLMLPAVELRIASARAGFQPARPGYIPAGGYELRKTITARPGVVEFQYDSGKNRYSITQTPSSLTSRDLAEKLYAQEGTTPQSFQNLGRTIYYYPNLAAWVSNGIEYTLHNSAHLSGNDIAAIAASM